MNNYLQTKKDELLLFAFQDSDQLSTEWTIKLVVDRLAWVPILPKSPIPIPVYQDYPEEEQALLVRVVES